MGWNLEEQHKLHMSVIERTFLETQKICEVGRRSFRTFPCFFRRSSWIACIARGCDPSFGGKGSTSDFLDLRGREGIILLAKRCFDSYPFSQKSCAFLVLQGKGGRVRKCLGFRFPLVCLLDLDDSLSLLGDCYKGPFLRWRTRARPIRRVLSYWFVGIVSSFH